MVAYYSRFVPGIARCLAPLHAATAIKGKQTKVTWTDECQSAFVAVKEALSAAVLLTFPDPEAETSLTCDASDTAVGAVVEQRSGNGSWQPVCFVSKKLSPGPIRVTM